MKKIFLLFYILVSFSRSHAQSISNEYLIFTQRADSLFQVKNYKEAIGQYNLAFESNNGLGKAGHRYNAASCWAILNYSDSAFYQLNKIADKGRFTKYEMIIADSNFISIHTDPRWEPLMEKIKDNKLKLHIIPDN